MPALPPMTTTICPSSAPLMTPTPDAWPAAWISPRTRLDRGADDLREAREGLDRVAQDIDRDPRADRQRHLLQPLAGLGPQA